MSTRLIPEAGVAIQGRKPPGIPFQASRLVFHAARLSTIYLTRHRFMAAVEIDVKYVAHLARLSLSPDEERKIGEQLGNILGYIEKLKEVDVSGVEPTAHAFPLVNVTRPDEVRPSLSQEDALRNAPNHANGLFMVPKIVE